MRWDMGTCFGEGCGKPASLVVLELTCGGDMVRTTSTCQWCRGQRTRLDRRPVVGGGFPRRMARAGRLDCTQVRWLR